MNSFEESEISEFFADRSLLITGATGFVGKILVEKLLRSCPKIKTIYVLLRRKRDKTIKQRLEELTKGRIFDRLKYENPLAINKIVAICGDMELDGLSLSQSDRELLINQVSVVFHSAATVRFDEPLRDALRVNVKATKSMLDLAHEIKNLDAFVHVSTAYAYCNQSVSKEVIYPMKASPSKLLEWSKFKSAKKLEAECEELFEGRPNTYTFTKALAEHYIDENRGALPVAIARPSIITSTWKEPVEGWIDSYNGPCGACMLGALGIARTMEIKPNKVADLIPADAVASALIAIAWNTGLNTKNGNNNGEAHNLKVFNITTSSVNPISWEKFLSYGREAAVEYPSEKLLRPPVKVMHGDNVNKFDHLMTKYCSELLFAYFVDLLLLLLGQKQRVVSTVGKMHKAFSLLKFFASRQWDLPNTNTDHLYRSLNDHDKSVFNFNVEEINWRDYTHKQQLGIRKYLLREDDSSIPEARKRMTRLSFGYHLSQYLLVFAVLYLFCKPLFRLIE